MRTGSRSFRKRLLRYIEARARASADLRLAAGLRPATRVARLLREGESLTLVRRVLEVRAAAAGLAERALSFPRRNSSSSSRTNSFTLAIGPLADLVFALAR